MLRTQKQAVWCATCHDHPECIDARWTSDHQYEGHTEDHHYEGQSGDHLQGGRHRSGELGVQAVGLETLHNYLADKACIA